MDTPTLRAFRDELEKMAGHAEDRAKERTSLTLAEVRQLKAKVRKLDLPRDQVFHYAWPNFRGYAVIAPARAGKHHVVKTILASGMKPPGIRLPLDGY